jgi:hypothetical protein
VAFRYGPRSGIRCTIKRIRKLSGIPDGFAVSEGLQEGDWNTLVLSITQGDCVLMLGPDAVTQEVDGRAVPLLTLFADQLRAKLTIAEPDAAPEGFTPAQTAQAFKARFGTNSLRNEADEFLRRSRRPSPILEDLAAMPFRLVVNTTPGLHMEEAFRSSSGIVAQTAWYRAKAPRQEMAPEGTAEKPLVFHLYGCVHDLKSLVLTESELLDFLVAIVSEDPPLPNNIRSAFAGRDNCFLFLGFGFKHWYLRILLHALSRSSAENRSFALEHFDESLGRSTIQTTKLFFQEGHKIHFFDMEADGFTRELRQRVEKRLGGVGGGQKQEISPDSATVFLCHASEDKDRARELSERLESAGIRPWLDKNDLRGGDYWDDRIERTIEHEVQYFLVLQSKALRAKVESYVNKEIFCAIERQKRFRKGARFIIPVEIDADSKLDELKEIQGVDCRDGAGFDRLVKTIFRDRELRVKGA